MSLTLLVCVWSQGNEEEAVLDRGKTSSTLYTNFEKEELESETHTCTHTLLHTQVHTVTIYVWP